MKVALTIMVLIGFVGLKAQAEFNRQSFIAILGSKEEFNYSNYYQVKMNESDKVNLLDLEKIQKKFPKPSEKYSRSKHFGGWIREANDSTCLDTRGKVLVRDSVSNVTYAPSGCKVQQGQWDDPYTALELTAARDIQIDHFVPLKNAYMTGAYEWNFNKRCLYANFMGNKFHLLSVSGHENMVKSDNSPSTYMPPNKNYKCQYLKQWLLVKTIWGLKLTPTEGEAIQKAIDQGRCDREDFITSQSFIREQKRYIEDNANLCVHAQISSFDSIDM